MEGRGLCQTLQGPWAVRRSRCWEPWKVLEQESAKTRCVSQGKAHLYNCSDKGSLRTHPFQNRELTTSQGIYLASVYLDTILEALRVE